MSAGTRLGRLIAAEPELTRAAVTDEDRAMIGRFVEYLTADEPGCAAMARNMERLKFETIVTGRSYAEVLAAKDRS